MCVHPVENTYIKEDLNKSLWHTCRNLRFCFAYGNSRFSYMCVTLTSVPTEHNTTDDRGLGRHIVGDGF